MGIQAAVTMAQLQQKLDLVGHNIANSETTGYKADRGSFSSLLFREIDNLSDPQNEVGRLTPDQIRTGTGARLGMTQKNLMPGVVRETDRDLDVSLLNPNTMLQVAVTNNGVTETHYTRDGSLYLSENEDESLTLVTQNGYSVLNDTGAEIMVPAGFNNIEITDSGMITADLNGQEGVTLGQLGIVETPRPRILEAVGENLFKLPEDMNGLGLEEIDLIQAVNPDVATIQSGSLEHSNVDMAEEMSELMIAQKSYQFNARTISMDDQMQGLINQLR